MSTSASTRGPTDITDRIASMRGWIFDVDGCLVRTRRPGGEGGEAFPGAAELLHLLRSAGRRIVLCTNASLRTPRFYAEQLRQAGLDVDESELVTAGRAGAEHIRRSHPRARVLALGGDGVTEPIRESGLTLVAARAGSQADVVFVGAGEAYGAGEIDSACQAVAAGAAFYVTVATRWFHGGLGRVASVSSAMAAAISWVTDVRPVVVGKPSPALAATLLDLLDLTAEEVAVVGDSVEADLQLAAEIGGLNVLVLTGATSSTAAAALPEAQRPDLVLRDVSSLYELLETRRQPQGGST